jgi:hypothetical protein
MKTTDNPIRKPVMKLVALLSGKNLLTQIAKANKPKPIGLANSFCNLFWLYIFFILRTNN